MECGYCGSDDVSVFETVSLPDNVDYDEEIDEEAWLILVTCCNNCGEESYDDG